MDLIAKDQGFKDPYLINAYITWKEERDIIIVTNLHTIIFNEDLEPPKIWARHNSFNQDFYNIELDETTTVGGKGWDVLKQEGAMDP